MRKGSAQAWDCTPDSISPTKPAFCETIWARRKDRYQNQSTPQGWTSFTGIFGKQIHVNRSLQRFQKLVRNVISGKRSSTFSSPLVGFLLTDPSTSFKVSQSFPSKSWSRVDSLHIKIWECKVKKWLWNIILFQIPIMISVLCASGGVLCSATRLVHW